jgi:hypothetical protein
MAHAIPLPGKCTLAGNAVGPGCNQLSPVKNWLFVQRAATIAYLTWLIDWSAYEQPTSKVASLCLPKMLPSLGRIGQGC